MFRVNTEHLSPDFELPDVNRLFKTSSGAFNFADKFMSENEQQGVLSVHDTKTDVCTYYARLENCNDFQVLTDEEWVAL